MKSTKIPYKLTNQFSDLVLDYINKSEKIKPFISYFPSLENLRKQIIDKKNHFVDRKTLVNALRIQNSNLVLSSHSKNNIDQLLDSNTFTVTTGHQLCFFTGPVYFIYKIISTINLVDKLNETYPQYNFVPIFWMASEDHDFEEINHFHFFSKKIKWKTNKEGMVGNMNITKISSIINELELALGQSKNAARLLSIFEATYKEKNLADATRFLINELFGDFGLVILDGNDSSLKLKLKSIIKKDILEKGFFKSITDCSLDLKKEYKLQAYVRERNFFRLLDNSRERIDCVIDEEDINDNLASFSPNVLLRPLYQETILPNIAYVGGGAEISYWLQLKLAFQQENIPMPILFLRNSVMILDKKKSKRLKSLGFLISDLFLNEDQLKNKFVLSKKDVDVSFLKEIGQIEVIYNHISKKTDDSSLKNSISSKLKDQNNFLKKLEKKLLKLEKTKYYVSLNQISNLKKDLFPNSILQERFYNFSTFYLEGGDSFIKIIKDNLDPLDPNFVVLSTKVN